MKLNSAWHFHCLNVILCCCVACTRGMLALPWENFMEMTSAKPPFLALRPWTWALKTCANWSLCLKNGSMMQVCIFSALSHFSPLPFLLKIMLHTIKNVRKDMKIPVAFLFSFGAPLRVLLFSALFSECVGGLLYKANLLHEYCCKVVQLML